MALVYCATNKVNGKKYIGVVLGDGPLERRIATHKYAARKGNQPIFYRAIRKYGFESFSWEVLASDLSDDQAKITEVAKIVELNTFFKSENPDCSCGYNMTIGGDGIRGLKFSEQSLAKMRTSHLGQQTWMKGRKHKLESLKKISENNWMNKNKGNIVVKESTRELLRSQKRGAKNPNFGKVPWNKGKRYSMSKTVTPAVLDGYKKNYKAVLRSDGLAFDSLKAAGLFMGKKDSALISRVLKTGKSAYGFTWRYV